MTFPQLIAAYRAAWAHDRGGLAAVLLAFAAVPLFALLGDLVI